MQLQASQIRQKSQNPSHPLHNLIQERQPKRPIKNSIFQANNTYTHIIPTDPTTVTPENIKQNLKTIHTSIVQKISN